MDSCPTLLHFLPLPSGLHHEVVLELLQNLEVVDALSFGNGLVFSAVISLMYLMASSLAALAILALFQYETFHQPERLLEQRGSTHREFGRCLDLCRIWSNWATVVGEAKPTSKHS